MKQDEAKALILHEWNDWWANNPKRGERASDTDGLRFFSFVKTEKPHLLDFRCRGDKWQIIKGWLLRAGVVND